MSICLCVCCALCTFLSCHTFTCSNCECFSKLYCAPRRLDSGTTAPQVSKQGELLTTIFLTLCWLLWRSVHRLLMLLLCAASCPWSPLRQSTNLSDLHFECICRGLCLGLMFMSSPRPMFMFMCMSNLIKGTRPAQGSALTPQVQCGTPRELSLSK